MRRLTPVPILLVALSATVARAESLNPGPSGSVTPAPAAGTTVRVEPAPGGGTMLRLGSQLRFVTHAQRDPNGHVTTRCVREPADTAATGAAR